MAQLIRPLRQWPVLQHYCFSSLPFHHLLNSILHLEPRKSTSHTFSLNPVASAHRNVHFRSRGLRLTNVPHPSELQNASDSDSDNEVKKSRNQLKREARRAVRWGMDLASFSPPQIKRILRAVSLEQEVFEALMLVKRLGPDVREGRRRQFNYIGKLLREVEPEFMDKLIKATKDADHKELQALCGLDSQAVEDGDTIETESDEKEEESDWYVAKTTRWFVGLVNKDIQITNEVYSLQGVEFDRQELRKLVRMVHSTQEQEAANEEETKLEAAKLGAQRALTLFLRTLTKQIPTEY
ncbi:hypothetical protein L6164_026486 [Bauhinia variegata]|uniref:Uncharacterized protein n=1 Tax=Bauhinia variegata TaxID=167791 RepID=A0ACB9LQA2_BAUVA|nr:hypothetical protein L6164_026486 [Bauhinia variegata]